MQEISFYLVDAFSDRSFGGNAAAVCPLTEWLPDETLLKMAQQHNQSETAFFVRTDEGYELRWFKSTSAATRPWRPRTSFLNILTTPHRQSYLVPALSVSFASRAAATG